jgi:hypothetical protein
MTSREAFEAHIKSMIESEAGEVQALEKFLDGDYITEWVRYQWYGWQAAIQHACDVAAEIVLRELDDNGQARAINDAIKEALK